MGTFANIFTDHRSALSFPRLQERPYNFHISFIVRLRFILVLFLSAFQSQSSCTTWRGSFCFHDQIVFSLWHVNAAMPKLYGCGFPVPNLLFPSLFLRGACKYTERHMAPQLIFSRSDLFFLPNYYNKWLKSRCFQLIYYQYKTCCLYEEHTLC